jgi:DNA-binding transcriptional ArsR family regulator
MHADKQHADVLTGPVASAAADSLALLADDTRLKILWVLMQDEANVGTIAELVGAKPPGVSQHLAKLRMAGMVDVRREGTFAFYRASDEHISRILVDLLEHTREELSAQAAVAARLKRTERVRTSPARTPRPR